MLNIYMENFTNTSILKIKDILLEKIEKNQYDFLVILPNRKVITYLRNEILKVVPAVYNLKIYSFDDIINKTNKDDIDEKMDDEIQQIIIKLAINKCIEKNILDDNIFFNSDGFLKICKEYIGLMKSSLIEDINIKKMINSKETIRFIALVYSEYENILKKFNIRDKYDFYKTILTNEDLKNVKDIYIDGYFEFRTIEYRIIELLSKDNKNINIYLHNNRLDDFELLKKTINKLKYFGFNLSNEESSKNFYQNLSSYMFTKKTIEENSNIKIVKCDDSYLEIKRLMIEIKKDKEKGIDFNNMKIIVNNTNEYLNDLTYSLKEENIPYEKNTKKNIVEYKIFSELLSILSTDKNLKDYILSILDFTDIFNFDKDISRDIKILLSGLSADTFNDYYNMDIFSRDINYTKHINLLKKIEKIYNLINRGNSVEIINYIQNILVTEYKEKSSKNNQPNYSYERSLYFKSLEKFIELLEKLKIQYKDILNELETKEFIKIMRLILSSYLINENLDNHQGIKIEDTTTSRLLEYPNIYILGLNSKNYPGTKNYDFFYNEINIAELKKYDIDILSINEENTRDLLRFLYTLSSVDEKLYLSYNTENDEMESNYLTEIKNQLDLTYKNYDTYSIKDYIRPDEKKITTQKDLNRFLATKKIKYTETYISQDIENKPVFTDNTLVDYTKDSKKKIYSATSLETYQRCPLQYYYKYVLAIKNEYIDDSSHEMKTIGKAIHKTLERFYSEYNDLIRNIIDCKVTLKFTDEQKKLVLKTLEEVFIKENFSIEDLKINSLINIYYDLILELIELDIMASINSDKKYYPSEFEKSFEVKLDKDGKEILLKGYIDRIDKDNSGNKILIDYKLGKSSNKNLKDFYDDKTLQFPIYALQENIDGCKYMTIRGKKIHDFFIMDFNNSSKAKTVLDESKRNDFRMKTVEKVFDIIKNIESANFFKGPKSKDDCKICEYKKICEYRRVESI